MRTRQAVTRVAIDTLRAVEALGGSTTAMMLAEQMQVPLRTAHYRLFSLSRSKLLLVAGAERTGSHPANRYAFTLGGKKVLDKAIHSAQVLRYRQSGRQRKDGTGKTDHGTESRAAHRRMRATGG